VKEAERKEYMKGQPERYARVYRDCARRKAAMNATRDIKTKETQRRKSELHDVRITSHFLIPQAD